MAMNKRAVTYVVIKSYAVNTIQEEQVFINGAHHVIGRQKNKKRFKFIYRYAVL